MFYFSAFEFSFLFLGGFFLMFYHLILSLIFLYQTGIRIYIQAD